MNRKRVCYLILLLLLSSQACGQKSTPPVQNRPSKTPFAMLPDYKVEVYQRIEGGYAGKVWKRGGITMWYGQGVDSGVDTDSVKTQDILWKQEQVINKRKVQCLYTKTHELVVSFPLLAANFRAKARTQQELADMLLMVATFDLDGYPIDPASLVPTPKIPK
jgi:hypothetical protein